MKNVSISYNPYKLKTHITVDGKELAKNSELRERSAEGNRLQEWVEDLPDMLLNEFNDNKFAVSFHGTVMDYEDLKEILDEAQEQHKFWYHLKWEKAQEAADKEKLIDEVFRKIQNGPFEELKSDEIKTAFQNAKSNDFEVCVVATMSAGKSTLINAMLGKELMPSKAGACTAMITRIKDVDRLKDSFRAEVYRKGRISETCEELDYSIMERLNEDDTVDEVRVYGNMPFVSSDELSLVLVDTPGPNNARDDSHEEVQQNALGKSSKALVLYIMTNEYGTDDDEITLRRVANTMSVGGKQSKDRFLFVVNKMDSRNKNDGSTEETLDQVREYLKAQGINNPNLFPAAALPALNIRRMEKEKVDEDIEEETEFLIRKLNRNEQLHLEKYASLPGNEKEDIEEQLKETQKDWKEKEGEKYENPQEALIHTGIISIEVAIRQYVEKYAKTARIKNIADVMQHAIETLDCETKMGNTKFSFPKEKQNALLKEIIDIICNTQKQLQNSADSVYQIYRNELENWPESKRNGKITVPTAYMEFTSLCKSVYKIIFDFKEDINNCIQHYTSILCNYLSKKYESFFDNTEIKISFKDLQFFYDNPVLSWEWNITPKTLIIDQIKYNSLLGEVVDYSDFYQAFIRSVENNILKIVCDTKDYLNIRLEQMKELFKYNMDLQNKVTGNDVIKKQIWITEIQKKIELITEI